MTLMTLATGLAYGTLEVAAPAHVKVYLSLHVQA